MIAFVIWLLGCVIELNDVPFIDYAEATCVAEGKNDFRWTFRAQVTDGNGPGDIDFVAADVFVEATGFYLESVVMERLVGTNEWRASFLESQSTLYCGEAYLIEFVAQDRLGAYDIYAVGL